MKRFTLALIAIIGLCSCEAGIFGEIGNGVSLTQKIEVGEFDRISIPSFVDVYYTQTSGEHNVTLTCDENLFKHYKIEVRDGKLVADCENFCRNKIDTYLTVCSTVLNEVKLSGSGDLHIEDTLKTEDNFTIEVNGSGDVEIDNLQVESATIRNSGSGDIEVDNMTAESIKISTSGSGDCTLECKDSGTLDIKISGSGDVNISGTARAIINISQTGSGDFNMSDLSLSGK